VSVVASAITKGHVQQARERLREQRLARARGADQQDVRLGELDVVLLAAGLQALVVVVDRDREDLLGLDLADHVLVEDLADLVRAGQVALRGLRAVSVARLFTDDVVAEVDALVADETDGPAMSFRTSCWLLPQNEQ
jgi:hypothetical protein